MFLDATARRNPKLIESAVVLHQNGLLPANSYVIDVDAVGANAGILASEAQKHNLKAFAMAKQFGRNPVVLKAIQKAGIQGCVAVDMNCARPVFASGMKVSHLGHLVQVPRHETRAALNMHPEYWTVFSDEKAQAISDALEADETQRILARITAPGDTFYRGHEGGFDAEGILDIKARIEEMKGLEFAGITSFPAQLFDEETRTVSHTPNFKTLLHTAEILRKSGMASVEVNAPGTTSSFLFKELAEAGVTQVEPGHGLTGTVPLNAYTDLAEVPAMVYVSEVSHLYGGKPYCFGGGMYIDPLFKPYEVKAFVGRTPEAALKSPVTCEIPSPAAIDYYGILQPEAGRIVHAGDSVVFGFRAQAFVTRAYVVPVSGIAAGNPQVEGIFTTDGRKAGWPEW